MERRLLGEPLNRALLWDAKRLGFSDAQIGTLADQSPGTVRAPPPRVGPAPGLQDGRHLRRRVRGRHAVLLRHVRAGERGRAADRREGRDPRLRPDPHRPGHRVRLLLGARRLGARIGRLPEHPDQQQPGDRQHRLRRLVPALLRAAGRRERASTSWRTSRRAATPPTRRSCSSSAARRPSTWPSRSTRPAPACSAAARRASTWPRTAASSRTWWSGWRSRSRPARRS